MMLSEAASQQTEKMEKTHQSRGVRERERERCPIRSLCAAGSAPSVMAIKRRRRRRKSQESHHLRVRRETAAAAAAAAVVLQSWSGRDHQGLDCSRNHSVDSTAVTQAAAAAQSTFAV